MSSHLFEIAIYIAIYRYDGRDFGRSNASIGELRALIFWHQSSAAHSRKLDQSTLDQIPMNMAGEK